MAVKKAVQCGNVEDAIEKVNDLNPEVDILIWNLLILWHITFVFGDSNGIVTSSMASGKFTLFLSSCCFAHT